MSLLQSCMVLGLAICLIHNVHSMDFYLMSFARDTVMKYSAGTERTVNILQPKLKVVNTPETPLKPRREPVGPTGPIGGGGGAGGAGGGGFTIGGGGGAGGAAGGGFTTGGGGGAGGFTTGDGGGGFTTGGGGGGFTTGGGGGAGGAGDGGFGGGGGFTTGGGGDGGGGFTTGGGGGGFTTGGGGGGGFTTGGGGGAGGFTTGDGGGGFTTGGGGGGFTTGGGGGAGGAGDGGFGGGGGFTTGGGGDGGGGFTTGGGGGGFTTGGGGGAGGDGDGGFGGGGGFTTGGGGDGGGGFTTGDGGGGFTTGDGGGGFTTGDGGGGFTTGGGGGGGFTTGGGGGAGGAGGGGFGGGGGFTTGGGGDGGGGFTTGGGGGGFTTGGGGGAGGDGDGGFGGDGDGGFGGGGGFTTGGGGGFTTGDGGGGFTTGDGGGGFTTGGGGDGGGGFTTGGGGGGFTTGGGGGAGGDGDFGFGGDGDSMDFYLMNFARDTVMKYSAGTERTVNILQPKLKVVNTTETPLKPRREPVGGGGGFTHDYNSVRFTKPKPKTELTFINRTKTYRRRTKPSNKFLEALAAIERAVAEAQVAGSRMRYSDQKLQAIKKTIKLAVQKRMYQFARHRLGQALFLIKQHNSTHNSRSRRSTQNQASVFMNDLKQTMGPTQFDKFMAVMGDVTLMFAIDTTGGMSDEIDTAKRIAVDVINYPRENPVNYILSPFNDPSTGPVIFRETTEGALFVDAINKLKATGGGDCPELTMKGILDALYEGPESGSPLYVFTDASAKDAKPEIVNEVKSMAKFLGKVVINFFTTALCWSSLTDHPFMEIAEATSGQMLSLASTTELQKLNGFTGSVLGGSNIISCGSNTFSRKKRAAASTASRYSITIDDSIYNISICITTGSSNQGAAISLTDPQGVPVTSGKVSMNQVSIYEIANPRVGNWTLVIPPSVGMHNYFVKSNSDQSIDFDYYFLMLVKKPASEVPVTDPLIGENSKVVITLAGHEKVRNNSVVLKLITKYGKHIRDIQLTPDSRGVRYTATLTPPSRPFKLKIKGYTKRGYPFERISRSIVEPKHVQLNVFHSANDFTLRRGTTSNVTFNIYNSAYVRKIVKINVKDRLGYASIKRNVHSIRRGRDFFKVLFTTPMSATNGTFDTAFISVSVDNDAEIVSLPVQLIVIE